MQLGLDSLLQPALALLQHLGRNVRAEITGLRVDRLVLLFNTQCERRAHGGLLAVVLLARCCCCLAGLSLSAGWLLVTDR